MPILNMSRSVPRLRDMALPSLLRPAAILCLTSNSSGVDITALTMMRIFSRPNTITKNGYTSLGGECVCVCVCVCVIHHRYMTSRRSYIYTLSEY